MEFRCKLSAVNDIVYKLWYEIKEPMRSYEITPTEESLGWGRSSVYEYDYTVYIPALKLFFRDATEFEFDEEEQKEMPIETILHCYREGETVPDYGCYTTICSHVLWYIKDQGISIENPDELECVIDMPYDVDVEDVTEKFEEFLNKIEWKEKATIIPEIFDIQYQEVYITKWIAYLLRQKYFGCMILNALLRINGSAPKIEEGDIRKVRTEYVFYNRRRIDILIFTKHFLVGIEHKIWSGEQKNQTADYQEHMRELSPNQEPIGIYLHPEQNRSESKDFRNVTYTELYDELSKVNISDVQESFEKRLFEQFMSYIKEYFYMKKGEFPEISKNAELYAKNISLIQDVYSEYKAVSHGVIEWLMKKFEDAGYAVLNNPDDNHLQYMQLAPAELSDKWSKIHFHFELLWQSDFMIDSEFKIDVHLENLKGHKGIGQDVKNHFKLTDDKERGDKMPLHSTILTGCSFEAKEKAEDTFKRILDVLKSKPFEDLAVKANTWTEQG